jgi:hypothetical protein
MHRRVLLRIATLFLPLSWAGATWAAEAAPAKPRARITVWDTGTPSAEAPQRAALAGHTDWTAIPTGTTADTFKGDAVLSNGRIAAVLRRRDSALELQAVQPRGAATPVRLRLLTARGEPAARLERLALDENTRGGACLSAAFTTAGGDTLAARFRIRRGDVSVQVEPGRGAGTLRVECPGRFAVLPDFFADDITVDATRLRTDTVELPSENFILHLAGAGDAIAMCVFENRRSDVRVTLAGEGRRRVLTASEVAFEGKKVWVALMSAPHIWHTHPIHTGDAGKVLRLDWTMPFPAQWRVDFTRPDELTDSWEMLLPDKDGYLKPSWLPSEVDHLEANRERWNTVLGDYPYPCWSDSRGRGRLQPLEGKVLRFAGPALLYPIGRVEQTPLDAYTVMDVMRNTLGVGPCEHILDAGGQKSEYRGRATCDVRDTLTPIYENGEQKKQRARVDRTLDEGLTFVKHIRGRITRYVAFGKEMRRYLAEQKRAHPEWSDFIDEMDRLTREIDRRYAARAAKMKTPDHVARMNAEFRKNVLGYDGPDALERCKAYAEALVEIGDNQDELSGECRWVVKALRQRAGILMARDPRVAPVALEIRRRTQEALRNPANHEGARH